MKKPSSVVLCQCGGGPAKRGGTVYAKSVQTPFVSSVPVFSVNDTSGAGAKVSPSPGPRRARHSLVAPPAGQLLGALDPCGRRPEREDLAAVGPRLEVPRHFLGDADQVPLLQL